MCMAQNSEGNIRHTINSKSPSNPVLWPSQPQFSLKKKPLIPISWVAYEKNSKKKEYIWR